MNYYDEIKTELLNNEINKKVKSYSINRSDLKTYYNVGKILSEAGKCYGDGIIKEYSKKLTQELKSKYDVSSLNKMKKFYILAENMATLSPYLTYSHYVELLPYSDINKVKYYVMLTIEQNLSVRQLRLKIKNKEYERLPSNIKKGFVNDNKLGVQSLVKNPIVLKNEYGYEIVSEKILQKLILEDIPTFLKELGIGFTFIENEKRIQIGNKYNYIDLLLYNIKYRCYVVVELKITELKKEHIGQIQTYMNYIDKNIKTIEENKTVGIIIVKKDDSFLMEYCSDERIITREFSLAI